MAVTLLLDRGNTYRIELRGRLHAADLRELERTAAVEIRRAGPIRLMVELVAFEGWETTENWHDLGFYVHHGDDIERIAIVGEERWRSEALMFAGAGLRKAPVAFFESREAARADAWLAE